MAFEIPSDLMVSVSGVRGRVGEALTPEVVARFAAAFGAFLRESTGEARPRVVLGRDSRTSGPLFARAAAAGLESTGCDVIAVGLAPTPTTLFAIRHNRAHGAIVVTASHNPVEWNALKFASGAGMFLDAEEAPLMRAFVAERPIPRAGWDALGVLSEDEGAVQRHLDAVLALPFLDVEGLRRRAFSVALDCIRGAGTVILPALLEALGCRVVGLNLEPDGRFHRPPEPVAENLGELATAVTAAGADLGMATDPDADRLSLVGPAGRAIGEDYTLALAAMLVLRHRSGPVVTNLSTSRILDDVAERAGQRVIRSPVGEIHVARRMEREGAVIGGEGNGGVILPDLHHTRDATVAAALTLQVLLETGKTLDELVAELPRYAIVKDKLPRDAGPLEPTYAALEARLGADAADRQDGLRLDWHEGRRWLHLRPSGTEPILRIIAEAPGEQEARALVEEARAALGAAAAGA
ncbi:MAG TPA: phosphoglucosamine mutase [Longimicrobiales bacterium]|nr:phosphoglucosamine mutase [Longimicrobiales bacterium]